MKIRYKEESDYGQDILEIIGMCASLQDPEKEYTLKDIQETMTHIRGKCNVIYLHTSMYRKGSRDREEYLGME